MGYVINFVDNQMVGAAEINSVTSELGGVSGTFEEGVTYGVGELNRISQSLISKGVSYGCTLSLSGGKVLIGAGVLFMSDGKRIEIDAEGVLLPCEAGVRNYVYFHRDSVLDVVSAKCTQQEPVGEDFVKLGEIDADGQLTGQADKATMKNSYLSLNHVEEHSVYVDFEPNAEEELVLEIMPEKVGCRFAIVSSETPVGISKRNNYFCGYVDLLTGKSFGVAETIPGKTSNFNWGVSFAEETGGKLQTGFINASGMHYKNFLRFSLDSDNILRVYRSAEKTGLSDANSLPPGQQLTIRLC